MSTGIYIKVSEDVPDDLLVQYEIEKSIILHRGCESRHEVAKHFI